MASGCSRSEAANSLPLRKDSLWRLGWGVRQKTWMQVLQCQIISTLLGATKYNDEKCGGCNLGITRIRNYVTQKLKKKHKNWFSSAELRHWEEDFKHNDSMSFFIISCLKGCESSSTECDAQIFKKISNLLEIIFSFIGINFVEWSSA